ncbi:cell surface protein SprA [Fibrobacter sp. UWH1]|uniref:T9SS outer membrane translocon Sov/SprA n=1 Tax=Fibrobacter sp. UWH1 TaxID=1964354 RepID=UPI0020CCBD04|nr:cell surface protein SprA [Fibrobacter sp. UWH1]
MSISDLKYWFYALGVALTAGFAWSQSDSMSVVSAADAEVGEVDPAETEWQPTMQYMELPPSVTPLSGMAPFGGIGSSPRLMNTMKGQVFTHDVDVATREMDISEKHVNAASRDTTVLWSAHYPELTDYVNDMYLAGRKNLWLNGLVGQANEGYETPETGSVFDITVPVTMPAWMRDFGLDKPKLMLQGTMDIRLKGYGEKDDAEGSTYTSLWPSPTLNYTPNFMVKGKIGPYITVEINNVEEGLGTKNQVRVVYEESYKDEFEDYILQRVEAGTTNLALTGTELTGYSENHQGLFGIKADWKLGDWRLTTIASQDGGEQEEYTLKASESTSEFQILDKQFIAYRYYFLNHGARKAYVKNAIHGKTTSDYPAAKNLQLYKRGNITTFSNSTKDVIDNVTAVYRTPDGKVIEKKVDRLIALDPKTDFTYDSKTGILKVNGVSRNTLIAASWSDDSSGRGNTSDVKNGSKVILVQWDAALPELTDIDKLMLRNVYSVGISDASASSYVLRMKNKSGIAGNYLKTLGLVDDKTGSPLVNDATIFKKNESGIYTGEMWLPCKTTSDTTVKSESRLMDNCLEPLRWVDSSAAMAQMYSLPVYNLSRYTSKFYFETVGKRRSSTLSVRDPSSSYSVNGSSCMDISPGSEKVTAGSTTLIRGTDYEVNYELGQIELLSERALDPNKEIKVSYECEPLFEIDNKLLLGARAELPLDLYGLGAGSVLGITALYKSQSTTAEVPTLGNEPYSSVLLGMNLRLQDTVNALTELVDAIPGINATAPSSWRFEAEIAASHHNANTSENQSALVEDFEATTSGLTYPLSRLSWYQASPPGGTDRSIFTYIPELDYRHQGEFIWHSNNTELYKNIYPAVGNSDVDNQHLTVLKMTLRPNDNLMGNSWGGVMRPNSAYYQDMSDLKYVEVVARGNVGSIYLDLGLVSEDLSINGDRPNEKYDGENDLGTTTALHDKGLDNATGADEVRYVWKCSNAGCESREVKADAGSTDIARDDYDDDLEDLSDPPVNINGTENNSGERSYDTEDINKNGALDTDISFVRYRIDLSDTLKAHFEELKNGWRKWRIPLNQYDTIVSSTGSDYLSILSGAQYSRLWMGSLNKGVAEAKVQIVHLAVVGNAWEETTVADLYRTSTNENSQIVEINGVETQVSEVTSARDTTYIKVSTINNRENSDKYSKSPNTATERDSDTNAPLKETALVLDYHNMQPGQEVGVTRIFETDKKDFSSYKSVKMEIHYAAKDNTGDVRFAIQFGEGSLEGSSDYYEWSFKPVKLECSSTVCHDDNWLDNAFSMNVADFSDLKRGRTPPFVTAVEKKLKPKSGERDREEKIRLVGNPSITSIDWMRFVIIADSSSDASSFEGTFWVDDLRLSDMDTDWGYAGRVGGQVNFSDFISLSGTVRYQDGNFATLSTSNGSPKPKVSEAASQLDVASDFTMNLNKFLDDSAGFHIPLSLGYHSTTKRPYMKPTDDMMLNHSSFVEMTGDMFQQQLEVDPSDEQQLRDEGESKGYQSYVREKTIGISYRKDYKAHESKFGEVMSQIFLDRPAFSYSYTESEGRSTTSADSTYSYHTILEYKLGTFSLFKFKPMEGLSDISWLKELSKTEFEPWPQTFDLTLFDLNYVRYVNQARDPDYVDPQVDKVVTYTTELNHKLNMRWNIFSFLTTSYSLNIKRDMYGGGDREAFVKKNFFTSRDGGLFASDYVFDFDHTDRKVYISSDSVLVIPYDTIPRPKLSADGDTLGEDWVVDMQNPDSYEILYDSTRFYKVDSVGHREYGRSYGILRNERARSQQFRIGFNPRLIPFIPFTTNFTSDFSQQKTIPDDFSFRDETMIEKNYWTISQTNRFEFSPTFRILDLAQSFGKENAVASALEKIKWREIRFNWTASTNTVGENFTLSQLYEDQGVTPLQYYLYGLGLGNGYRNRGLYNIVTGDMGLDHRDDFRRFAQYRNHEVDTLVYQGNFRHAVSRQFQVGTGITLPIWDIGVTGDLQWKEDFSQSREYPLYIDTTTLWPKIGVGVTVPNFAQRVSFLNDFKSVSTSHRFDYSYTTTVHPFQSAEDSWSQTLNFNPLVKITFLLQNNMRIENAVRMKIESTDRRPKEEVVSCTSWAPENQDCSGGSSRDTTDYFWETPWIHTALYNDFAFNIGDDFTVTYPLKLDKVLKIWKWFYKFKNSIDLKFTAGYDYKKTIRKEYVPNEGYDMWAPESGTSDGVFRQWSYVAPTTGTEETLTVYNPKLHLEERRVPSRTHEWFLRPAASYQFNKMASMSSYVEYRQIHEKLDDETPHLRQILQFEIALMLRFN